MRTNRDTERPLIRPRDPRVIGLTTQHMRIPSHEAVRRMLQLGFRDSHTCLDLTFAAGNFWQDPLPPGITLTTSNIDPAAATDLHCDFTASGLPDRGWDVVLIDPPHNADAGELSFMKPRYGTIKGTDQLQPLIEDGVREAWRLCRVGILVKICDQNHGSELVEESQWVRAAVAPTRLYTSLDQLRAPTGGHGRRKLHQRVAYTDGSTYLMFRKDSHTHRDWDKEYARQEALRCLGCNRPLIDKRKQATTCTDRCRARLRRVKAREALYRP